MSSYYGMYENQSYYLSILSGYYDIGDFKFIFKVINSHLCCCFSRKIFRYYNESCISCFLSHKLVFKKRKKSSDSKARVRK